MTHLPEHYPAGGGSCSPDEELEFINAGSHLSYKGSETTWPGSALFISRGRYYVACNKVLLHADCAEVRNTNRCVEYVEPYIYPKSH